MSDLALRKLSEEEYLRTEELSPVRREYVDGFVYAHAGASLPHNRISSNIQGILIPASRRGSCWTYTNDMKVRVKRLGQLRYSSPDLVVVCKPHEDLREAENHPCLIVEILSQSTRQVDMTYKAQDYLSLHSLRGYLLVDSEDRAAEFYRRMPNGWELETVENGVRLPCVDVELRMEEVYAGVGAET
ncbi:Uma2 family endonuclease [Deinococcus sp. YIM 134068]|uniref:Uma2 family endonuclease n=1 Tax=Deinococcus lichenicola TaxID=3118910 RepID=UPI002F9242F6